MNKRQQFVVVLATATVISGGIISFSMQAEAEADRRQAIYNEAVAIRNQREADRLKAEEPYRLEAEQERFLVEKARADGEKAKAKADEAFARYILKHPVPDVFVAEVSTSTESNLLNCSYEYELEHRLDEKSEEETYEEETSEEEPSDEEASKEELSDEEPSDEEPSDEEPSDEEPSNEEPSNEETASTTALKLSEEERNFALRVFAAESGDYNSDEFMIANAWLIRNAIEYYDGDVWAALTPQAYQVVCSDGEVRGAEGIVTLQMAMESERVYSIFNSVMDGEIPSPIADYTCGLPYDVWEYESGYEFASDHGIAECSVVDNCCYFPASCWTEALTELLNNTPA